MFRHDPGCSVPVYGQSVTLRPGLLGLALRLSISAAGAGYYRYQIAWPDV